MQLVLGLSELASGAWAGAIVGLILLALGLCTLATTASIVIG